MLRSPELQSTFVQASESAVFGELRKDGTLQFARGGRLRIAYRDGMVLVCDGESAVQFDPRTRTAQRFALDAARKDMPLLNILVDPGALDESFRIKGGAEDQVVLEPKQKGLPLVTVDGAGGRLKRVTWTDPTGARQQFELKDPHVPGKAFPPSTFRFAAPAGTRWIH
ncbi:MAG TPA: outer membrane lipoprotein carrier protein LolA [Holophaga sp.]|nr:outer membrane lipoprotein carrier protein LolA [Holophaga sp.]